MGSGELVFMGIKFQFEMMKEFWRWMANNVNIFDVTELYT